MLQNGIADRAIITRALARLGGPPFHSLTFLFRRTRSALWRAQCDTPWRGQDRIVVKQAVGNDARDQFNHELAALQLLNSGKTERPIAPRLLAWDNDACLLYLEDLGGLDLAKVLLGSHRPTAQAGLLAYATSLGQLHALTTSHDRSTGMPGRHGSAYNPSQFATPFAELCAAAGTTVSTGFVDEVARIQTLLGNEGPFRALVHGDPCPDNIHLAATGAVFIDFETATSNHALLDAAYFSMAFPTCWCVGAIPQEILDEMESIYRRTLAVTVPETADNSLFFRHLLHASARWLLDVGTLVARAERIDGLPISEVLETNGTWGTASARQRFSHRLQSFIRLASKTGDLPSLTDTARRLRRALASRWTEIERQLPPFPAFTAKE